MQLSVVSYLDKKSTKEIREIQAELFDITNSRSARDSWEPHITICDGVEIESDQLGAIVTAIKNIVSGIKPMYVEAIGFGGMNNRPIGEGELSSRYVLWLNINSSEDLNNIVIKLSHELNSYKKWYKMPKPYTPHITLAFRDLDEIGYRNGVEFLKDKELKLRPILSSVSLVEKLANTDEELIRIEFGNTA